MLFLAQSFAPGMDLLMQICFLVCGGYGLYTWRNMDKWSSLPANKIIYPYGCPTSNCDDPEALKKFMRPRILIFSILCLATGIFSLVTSRVLGNSPVYVMLTAAVGMAAIVFYMVTISQASKKFW